MLNVGRIGISLCLMVVFITAGCRCCEEVVLVVNPAISESAVSAIKRDQVPPGDSSGYAVIGHLKMRDHWVTMLSGSEGPLYTVKSRTGQIILWEGSGQGFQAALPQLHEQIEGAVAGSLWAGPSTAEHYAFVGVVCPRGKATRMNTD